MKKYLLEIIVFICGAVVMILEIVGARILAPFLGTSMIVWTSLIGMVLGSLSFGYWYGGKLSDKKPDFQKFSFIIFSAGLFVGLFFLVESFILTFIQNFIQNIYLGTIMASFVLFSPPSVLLGMVSPYVIKLKLDDLKTSGATVGNLFAFSTLGSIVGTFAAGFLLIPWLGSQSIIFYLSVVLIFSSLVVSPQKMLIKVSAFFLISACFFNFRFFQPSLAEGATLDIDTRYNRVIISDYINTSSFQKIRGMSFSPHGMQSAMFLEDDDLVFDYTKFYRLGGYFNPNIKEALMIGGAGYSYPKDFLSKHSDANMDVIEIDPKLTELAKDFLN